MHSIKIVGEIEAKKREPLDNLAKQIVKGAGVTFFGDFVGKGINFLSQIILARLLGSELFGVYALGLVIFNLAQTISVMGLSQGALRYVSIYHGEGNTSKVKGIIIQSIGLPFLVGMILGFLLFLGASNIANAFGNIELTIVIKIISIGIPFMAAMMVAIAVSRGFKKMQYFVYVKNVFHPIVNLALVILMYWLGFRLLGAISAWVFAAVAAFILSAIYIKKEFPIFFDIKATYIGRELFKFSGPLVLVGFIQLLFVRTDVLMLGYFRSASEVGIYNAVSQGVLPLVTILMAFNSIFSPIVADLYHRNDLSKLNDLLKIVAKWTFIITCPILIIIILSPREILNIFGAGFSVGSESLVILAVFLFFSVSFGPVPETLVMSGKQTIEFYNTLGGLVLNIVLNFLFIPKYGIEGAALATGISILSFHIIRVYEASYYLKLWPISKKYLKGLVAGLLTIIIGTIFKAIFREIHYIYYLVMIGIVVSVSFVVILLLLGLDEEDMLIIRIVKQRIRLPWALNRYMI